MEPTFTPWALLADSSSGSTWVNHVLSSHRCAVSQGELLMKNQTAAALFHSSAAGIERVLLDVTALNFAALRGRPGCARMAGGVKLKLVERDILFGSGGNAMAVATALARVGYRVIVLQRANHLDSLIGASVASHKDAH